MDYEKRGTEKPTGGYQIVGALLEERITAKTDPSLDWKDSLTY